LTNQADIKSAGVLHPTSEFSHRGTKQLNRQHPNLIGGAAVVGVAVHQQQRCSAPILAPLRKTSVSGTENVPGWVSWKTLVSVTAYHSFGGEVEALNPPRYAALPLHAVTNFRP
jgi:hypothetical protein